jgi:hypothetical protein
MTTITDFNFFCHMASTSLKAESVCLEFDENFVFHGFHFFFEKLIKVSGKLKTFKNS